MPLAFSIVEVMVAMRVEILATVAMAVMPVACLAKLAMAVMV